MDMTTGEMAPALADGAHDAPPLDPAQAKRVQALAHAFYQVVPHDLSTYCSLTSRISQAALSLLGDSVQLLSLTPACAQTTGSINVSAARAQGAVRSIVATARSPQTRQRVAELGLADQVVETSAAAVA